MNAVHHSVFVALALAGASSAQGVVCLSTTWAGGNGGLAQGVVFFDLDVAAPVVLEELACHFDAPTGTPVGVELFTTPGSHLGAERNRALWTAVAEDDGLALAAGPGLATAITLARPLPLRTGSIGVALVARGATGHVYTNGDGTNQLYSDGYLTLRAGSAQNLPFQSTPFVPRVWNGSLCHRPLSGPRADFDATPVSGGAPLLVQFFDRSLTSDPGGIVQWEWDVDDDGVVDYTVPDPQHTFVSGGRYDVRLTVRDALGSATTTREDLVLVDVVTAAFTWTRTGPRSFAFQDLSTGNPTNWAWDFDGDLVVDSTDRNPTHDYTGCGPMRCWLLASNAQGSDAALQTIEVGRIALPPFSRTLSSPELSRGFYFVAPTSFSIRALQVPDEAAHGTQVAAIYRFGSAPPEFPGALSAQPDAFVVGVSSATDVPVAISFAAGEWVGVLGGCGDATVQHTSYGDGEFATDVLGSPTVLHRLLADVNLTSTGGAVQLSADGTGSIGRVHLCLSNALGFDSGIATAAGPSSPEPVMTTTALPVLGARAELEIRQFDPGAVGFLLVGLTPVDLPTPFGRLLVANILDAFPLGAPMTIGSTRFGFTIPNDPALDGVGPIVWQDLQIVPGSPRGWSMSNRVQWTIGR